MFGGSPDNTIGRYARPASSAACSFRDGVRSSRREDGVGNARAAHLATPRWRHTPRRSMLCAAGSAISPSHATTAGAAADFIRTPARRNPASPQHALYNAPDKIRLQIMRFRKVHRRLNHSSHRSQWGAGGCESTTSQARPVLPLDYRFRGSVCSRLSISYLRLTGRALGTYLSRQHRTACL